MKYRVLNDSVSGENVLSGSAPFDTTLCLPMGYYNLVALDSYTSDSYMTITDISNGSVYFTSYFSKWICRIF